MTLQKKVSRLIHRSNFDVKDFDPSRPRTIFVEEFEPSVFRQLIDYCHTGCATMKPRTVLGLLNAADYYGLEELRRACLGFLQGCINIDTVCLLLRSAEKYIQYKATKSLVQKALEFIDANGASVLQLSAFTSLPEHVVRLILSRDDLNAAEYIKFEAALSWSNAQVQRNHCQSVKSAITPLLDCIAFQHIPTSTLMQSVRPLNIVSDQTIMTALAYQADPSSLEQESSLYDDRQSRLRLSLVDLRIEETVASFKSDDYIQSDDPDIEYDFPDSVLNFDMGEETNESSNTCHSDEPRYYGKDNDGHSIASNDEGVVTEETPVAQNGGNITIRDKENSGRPEQKPMENCRGDVECCSMSTCSSNSFGKADRRNILFTDSDGLPELP